MFVVRELILELVVFVVVGGFEFVDFVLEEEDLGGVVFLEGLDLDCLFGCVLLPGVL